MSTESAAIDGHKLDDRQALRPKPAPSRRVRAVASPGKAGGTRAPMPPQNESVATCASLWAFQNGASFEPRRGVKGVTE
jgi:hypothetical protein